MLLFECLSIIAYYLQLVLIGGGLWLMNRASNLRSKQLDQQHEETLLSLRALIERTARQQG